ncbi:MAG: hypothetical protein R2741_07585 [Methanolobus sp.]
MKLAVFLIVALFLSLLSFSASYDVISNGEEYMTFKQVTVRFQGTDAIVSVSYGLDMFSSMYVFLMGAHNLEPSIDDFFIDFGDMEVIKLEKIMLLFRQIIFPVKMMNISFTMLMNWAV